MHRITSTYTAVNWLTTGMRWARAAPSVIPIAYEPTIAIAETLIVLTRPCQSSWRFSETNPQRS